MGEMGEMEEWYRAVDLVASLGGLGENWERWIDSVVEEIVDR